MSHKETSKVLSLLDKAYQCRVNDLKQSIELTKQALSISEKSGDRSLIAKSLSHLSLFYMITGEFDRSLDMAHKAIVLFEELNDEKGVADAKYNLAGLHYKTDDFHTGLAYLIECLSTYRRLGDHHHQAKVLKSIGTIYEFFGDQKSAIESYENAIKEAQLIGDESIESNAYNPLSGVYLNQGKIEESLALIEKSISIKERTQDIRGLAFALYGRGKVYTKTGEFDLAEKDLKRSIEIHEEMGEKIGLGMSYYKLGTLYKEKGDIPKARHMLTKAIDFGHKHNISWVKYRCNQLLYEISKAEGDLESALKYLEEYIKEKDVVINTQTFKVIESYEALMKMKSLEREAQVRREKAEIIEKKNLAEKASKMKEDFLSTMSHEIRTPLNAVITIAGLLKEKSGDREDQLLDSLKISANNLMLIINDILDFTKLDSGKVTLDARPTNLPELVAKIRNTYGTMAHEKGLILNTEVGDWLKEYYTIDETKLFQILGNLVSNAIKFTEMGRIDLTVIKVGEIKGQDKVRFKVTDTGIGIPEEDFETIFDSFSQPKQLTTRKEGGSGLGLAIVRKLVKLHQSEISVESKVGVGTTFWFDLVLAKGTVKSAAVNQENGELRGLKVLIADDMKINAMVAEKLLSSWGMVIDNAENGEEAVQKAQEQAYDLVLMDIHMPVVDGFEATRRIRETSNPNRETPIFAVTADVTAEQRELYRPYFNEFILKPINKEKLYQTLIEFSSPGSTA